MGSTMGQYIKLLGVLDDGSDFDPEVPRNTAQPMAFPRLADVAIELEVITNSGASVDLSNATNTPVTLTIRLDLPVDVVISADLQKTGVPKAGYPNVVVFNIAPADTENIPHGNMYYDVSMTRAGKRYQLKKVAIATIEPACSAP